MGKAKEEKSDDIEIISIGKLYTGPWDKKYWSSSRGKDRYPYPVGYRSVRTLNGITYKMEILEGLKGPSFTINSSDGKSCSGETPDIAWECFQKKGCSAVKLWNGKRFSCKIRGVEFFGFKNAFVQRLLRELVANVGGSSEQSSLEHNALTSEVSYEVNKLKDKEPSLDLMPCFGDARNTVKRSRDNNMVKTRQKNHRKQLQHEKAEDNTGASNAIEIDKSDDGNGDSSTSVAANRVSVICGSGVLDQGNLESIVELDNLGTITEVGMEQDPLENSHYLKNDVSNSTAVRGSISDEYVVDKIQHDVEMVIDVDLCIPDTLDQTVDNCTVTSPRKHVPSNTQDVIPNDLSNSELSMTDSHLEDGMYPSTFSEKYGTDLAGEEIAKSMMTVLLPRALPLMKTFSRKKKKNTGPSIYNTRRSEVETNISDTCIHDTSQEGEMPEHLRLESQKDKASVPLGDHDSMAPTFENTNSVVADSFDSVDPLDLIPCSLDTHAQLTLKVVGEKSLVVSHNETGETVLNMHGQTQTVSHEKPQKESVRAPEEETTANSRREWSCGSSMNELPNVHPSTVKCFPIVDVVNSRSSADGGLPEKSKALSADKMSKDEDSAGFDNSTSNLQKSDTDGLTDGSMFNNQNNQQQPNSKSKTQGLLELSACYVLPMPISTLQLIVRENDIYICVQCGYLEHKEGALFAYKASTRGENMGCPSVIGHAPIALHSSANALGSDTVGDISIFQFTPDAKFLVVNNIKAPYCREGKLDCLCPACALDCCTKNTMKIVQLNSGYVSLVTRLETTEDVCCFLVCGPNFLLSAEDSGQLKLWVMNSGWSAVKEHVYLPTLDCMFPCLVELKRIPQSASLIVGHNGIGEFGLWDIEKRSLLSMFSSPGIPVLRCIPAGIFRWRAKGERKKQEHIDEILEATKAFFTRKCNNDVSSAENEDVTVWLLISTISDPDFQNLHCQSSGEKAKRVRCWRLAFLANNKVISGSAIDSGAAAVTSLGHGVIGRSDGLVYAWELSTGAKLANLHSFKGTGLTCVTSDPTNSDALAIAGGNQLLVYLLS